MMIAAVDVAKRGFLTLVPHNRQVGATVLLRLTDTSSAKNRVIRAIRICTIEVRGVVDGVRTGASTIVHQAGGHTASLTHGLSECHEVIFLVQLDAIHAHHLPADGGGDAGAMLLAQVPAMRVSLLRKRANDGRLL